MARQDARLEMLREASKADVHPQNRNDFRRFPIPLEKWLPAAWLVIDCKNGVSSYEIARDLEVTQKSAWFMLHRVRLAMQDGSFEKLSGDVEADESFIGGKIANMNKKARARVFSLWAAPTVAGMRVKPSSWGFWSAMAEPAFRLFPAVAPTTCNARFASLLSPDRTCTRTN